MPMSKKKRTTVTPEPSMSESSISELPEQHVFHQHLRHLAQSAVRIVIESVMREELDAFISRFLDLLNHRCHSSIGAWLLFRL